jgi:3-phosphoglycerate kinase
VEVTQPEQAEVTEVMEPAATAPAPPDEEPTPAIETTPPQEPVPAPIGTSEHPDLPTIDDLDVEGQRVLVRCDFNVPLEDGRITDDMRIRASIPTLDALLQRGARLAVCSHLGRPKGKVNDDLRLAPIGERLSQLLALQVEILDEVVGVTVAKACASDARLVLLENLRFDPGEEANDEEFAAALTRP